MGDEQGQSSQRYDLGSLLPNEGPETLHFLKVSGWVVVVLLVGLALAYPFFVG